MVRKAEAPSTLIMARKRRAYERSTRRGFKEKMFTKRFEPLGFRFEAEGMWIGMIIRVKKAPRTKFKQSLIIPFLDIAVGAFQSSQAVVLRTKPVMQITGSLKSTQKTINLDEKLCTTEFGRMSCEKVKVCLKYNGQLQPIYNSIEVKLRLNLDSKKGVGGGQEPRAFFSRKDLDRKRGVKIDPKSISQKQPDRIEQTIQLNKGREQCESYDVYVPDTIRDKLSPIVISVNYTYVERGSRHGELEPAVDTTLPQSFETELTIEKDCGDDNVCVPDLKIFAQK